MSIYAQTLAQARLDALRRLLEALNEANTPDEKRRCAVAILNAPDPCEVDDYVNTGGAAGSPASEIQTAPHDFPSRTQTPPPAPTNTSSSRAPSPHAPSFESLARTNAQLDEIEKLLSTLESCKPKRSHTRSLLTRAGQAPLPPPQPSMPP